MNEREIVAWCDRYKNVKAMVEYIVNENEEPVTQERFVWTLAEIAVVKDNPEALTSQYGKLYKWLWRYEAVIGEKKKDDVNVDKACFVALHMKGKMAMDVNMCPECALPAGWKWVLQLRTKQDKWLDWIYIMESNRTDANLGVFTARDFPKGSTIGYYCGLTVWRSDIAGSKKPTDDELIAQGVTCTRKGLTVMNNEAKWHTIAAKDVEPGATGEEPLYLGMHYLNSACFSLEVGSREYEKARKEQNCVVLHDGSVKAIKKIPRNYEVLLMGGHSEEHMGSTRSKVECFPSRQQNQKKARFDIYEDRKL